MAENMEMNANRSHDLGEAMSALSEQQQKFVWAYAGSGQENATRAAIAAGYVDNNNGSIRVQAHRLLHNPRIKAALIECSRSDLAAGARAAAKRLLDEVENPQSKDGVAAAKFILQAVGAMVPTETRTTVEHVVDVEASMATIQRLAAKYGNLLPPTLQQKLIDVTPAAPSTILSDDELTAL
jgi:Terminase small subunit